MGLLKLIRDLNKEEFRNEIWVQTCADNGQDQIPNPSPLPTIQMYLYIVHYIMQNMKNVFLCFTLYEKRRN